MKLLQLTATFGCLQGDTLEFGPGMTLIGAPNGSGKSTWCAFLRTMLYGLDTRQPCTKAESLEPGKPRRSQSQHPAAPRQSTPSRGQQEPGESQRQRTQGKASTQQRRRGRKASRGAPALPSPGNRERLRPCRASAQPNTRASPTACTQGADDLERERGGEGRRERERTENHSIRAPPTTCTR